MADSGFQPIKPIDGYLPLEDFGLVGDGTTAALVGRDGAVWWLCAPRFDSPPIFARILDRNKGGALIIAPEGLRAARQYYEENTAILVTEIQTESGSVRLSDALALKGGADMAEDTRLDRSEFVRQVEVLSGEINLRVEIEPMGDAEVRPAGGGFVMRTRRHGEIELRLSCSHKLSGLPATLSLSAGDRASFSLSWAEGSHRFRPLDVPEILDQTRAVWRRWIERFDYDGPDRAMVLRSAITLKLMDYTPNGAIIAAPTSSLPEHIGGPRNWDYRYAWIRDAAFSVYALRRIGYVREAASFLGWVLDAVESGERPAVLYNLDGRLPDPERQDPELEGYRRSGPVRWGNAAADQRQHDVYGEILDCAYQWITWDGGVDEHLWRRLLEYIESARREWRDPDHGIWEVRTSGQVFTYSAALCHVALDRGARLAERLGLEGDFEGWRAEAKRIEEAISREGWSDSKQAFTQYFGGEALDASALSLPLRRVIAADDPRMVSTTDAVRRELGVGKDLLLRYNPDEAPDGLEGEEGAFLLCSFWLVDNLAAQGKLDEALDIFHSLCSRAGTLGLLPEQIDQHDGSFLGNYPQAFSHIGLISSGVNLGRRMRKGNGRT
jgi:alpha,alpha-trehalase